MSELARHWLDLVEKLCPEDWFRLFLALDVDAPDRCLSAQALPVLSFLEQMSIQASADYHPIIDSMIHQQSTLHFGQTYNATDFGAAFMQQYGWIKLLGPDAYWHSDILSSGFILLGDDITYPEHWHVAEEIYIPISGTAEWYHQDAGWRVLPPGTLIHHQSNVKHAIRTIGEPMMALYVWRGGDLTQKSTIQE